MTSRSIGQIIKGTRHLLLDFDGPVCSVFAGTPASDVASQLRYALQAAGFSLPGYAQEETDPLEVFREAAKLSPAAAAVAQQLLTAFEARAIVSARSAGSLGPYEYLLSVDLRDNHYGRRQTRTDARGS